MQVITNTISLSKCRLRFARALGKGEVPAFRQWPDRRYDQRPCNFALSKRTTCSNWQNESSSACSDSSSVPSRFFSSKSSSRFCVSAGKRKLISRSASAPTASNSSKSSKTVLGWVDDMKGFNRIPKIFDVVIASIAHWTSQFASNSMSKLWTL